MNMSRKRPVPVARWYERGGTCHQTASAFLLAEAEFESSAEIRIRICPWCTHVLFTGQSYVRRGSLTATVVIPAHAGHALETFVKAAQTGVQPPERTLTVPESYPSLDELKSHSKKAVAVKA